MADNDNLNTGNDVRGQAGKGIAHRLFGWAFRRVSDQDINKVEPPSFAPKEHDDGSIVVTASGAFGTYVDLDGTVRTEAELISRYRDMSLHPEIDAAIDECVNEAISVDEDNVVKIVLDKLDFPDKVKNEIERAFQDVLRLLDFQNHAYSLMRRWFIDGRLYFHTIIDEEETTNGIRELRYIDPRKIRKVREIVRKRVPGGIALGAEAVVTQTKNEYFIYNDKGFNIGNKPTGPNATGLRIAKDAICYVTSGLTDTAGSMVLSFLHKAIKPLQQLRTLEDAVVIYRISRAPERRVWYIDVGNLPKMKAEQYVRDIMVKHKNRLVYDASTGQVRDDRRFMTMLDDYWLPRREGGKGTEVDVLPGGQNLGQMEDVLYFQKRLYASLHVPLNRLDPNNQFNIGVATEITRDEVKFGKFISRMRARFSLLFIKLLEKQIVLKGVMALEDWNKIAPYLRFDFIHDNFFIEMKNSMVYNNRFTLATAATPFIGKYFSNEWIRKKIFMQTDEEIEEIDKQIVEELSDPIYSPLIGGPGEGEEGEQEEQGPGTAGVMADPNAALSDQASPDNMMNQGPKDKEKPRDFKSIVKKLSKNT